MQLLKDKGIKVPHKDPMVMIFAQPKTGNNAAG
jgi:hypothetical protein